MKVPRLVPVPLLAGALVCCSCLVTSAQTLPASPAPATLPAPGTPSVPPSPVAATPPTTAAVPVSAPAKAAPSKPAPIKLAASTTSLNLSYPDVPRGESVKLLDAKVSFAVKDASFLTALTGVLAAANVNCSVEARGVKAMRLSLKTQDDRVAPILDALARAGGARLWVFATKLLIAPEALLTPAEKKEAKLYGVLITAAQLPKGTTLTQTVKGINVWDVANTKISVNLSGNLWELQSQVGNSTSKNTRISILTPDELLQEGWPLPTLSASLTDVSFLDALTLAAHSSGCEVYLGDNGFLLCAPDNADGPKANHAIPAFNPSSTHFNFGPNAPFDPSAKSS